LERVACEEVASEILHVIVKLDSFLEVLFAVEVEERIHNVFLNDLSQDFVACAKVRKRVQKFVDLSIPHQRYVFPDLRNDFVY
jgi:hypothetical protein